jgi:cytochrome c oxidase subunit 2
MAYKRLTVVAATAIALGMLLTGCGTDKTAEEKTTNQNQTNQQAAAPSGDEQVVHVVGKNFTWELDKTEVKAGKPVKLVITSKEGYHGLTIPGTDVNNVKAKAGEESVATFTPEKPGDLFLKCSIMCGTGHGQMVVPLKVVQ